MGQRGRPRYPDVLTPREQDVLALIRDGLTNEQIAERLNIGFETAKSHVAEILSKLGVATREEAAAWQPEAERAPRWSFGRVVLAIAGAGVVAHGGRIGAAGVGLSRSDTGSEAGTASPSVTTSSGTPTLVPAATPVPLGKVITTIEGNVATEADSYSVDVETGQVWRGGLYKWSPDGTRVVQRLCCAVDASGIEIIDWQTGEGVRILDQEIGSVAWSPDSSRIAFTPYQSGGVFLVRPDGANVAAIESAASVRASGLQWSPGGRYLAFTSAEFQIQIIDTVNLSSTVVPGSEFDRWYWSPVANVIAYPKDDGVHLYDVASAQDRLLADGFVGGSVLWSPGGTKIAYLVAPITAGSENVYRVADIETGGVIDLPPARGLSWSPDGSKIAYIGEGCVTSDWNIYVINSDGTGMQRLTDSPDAVKEGTVWTPSGEVVYTQEAELQAVNVATGKVRTLIAAAESGPALPPHFHPMLAPRRR